MSYAELHCISNFTFLRGASRPEELVNTACELGYQAIAITDECSLAGVVKAHVKAKQLEKEGRHIKLIIGSEFKLPDSSTLIALATNKSRYQELSAFITLCRKRSIKGEYQLLLNDLNIHLEHCLLIYVPGANKNPPSSPNTSQDVQLLLSHHENLWVGYQRLYQHDDESRYQKAYQLANTMNKPMVACGNVHMHCHKRKPLQDTLTAIKKNTALSLLGNQLFSNSENYLRPLDKLKKIYPPALLNETLNIADRCHFSLEELRYEYPHELVPPNLKADQYLLQLVTQGANKRWNNQVPEKIQQQIKHELTLIKELNYEYFFLTVHDIVCFARQENILCQGRGSAANSVVCYCLFITEVDPSRIAVLFERFISKERNEPPDIDVDFEHERREEVIQYIYKKYSLLATAVVVPSVM
jgi:error-prone DNA polymerase